MWACTCTRFFITLSAQFGNIFLWRQIDENQDRPKECVSHFFLSRQYSCSYEMFLYSCYLIALECFHILLWFMDWVCSYFVWTKIYFTQFFTKVPLIFEVFFGNSAAFLSCLIHFLEMIIHLQFESEPNHQYIRIESLTFGLGFLALYPPTDFT